MSVYGKPDVAVVSSKTPVKHSIPYGAAKWAAECYLHNLQDQIPSISIRSPAIVGSFPSTHTHFLARVLRTMITGTEVVRLSNPEFLFNNVVHEETLAKFLVRLSISPLVGYQVVPVGSIQTDKLKDLIAYMAKVVGYSSIVMWDNGSESPFSIDIREAVNMGFQPLTSQRVIELWLANYQHRPEH
jgi:nucleoside-diphosphate-sugar epimerase